MHKAVYYIDMLCSVEDSMFATTEIRSGGAVYCECLLVEKYPVSLGRFLAITF